MDQVIVPIALFGPVSYYQYLLERPCLLDTKEVFVKQTYRSRFDILGPNGPLTLSVPVKKVDGSKTKTEDIEIDYTQDWRIQHLRSIRTAYASAPYFEHYIVDLTRLYAVQCVKLLDFAEASFKVVKDWFDLDLEWNVCNNEIPRKESIDVVGIKYRNASALSYYQVFFDRFDFVPDLSILDLVMNEGPMGRNYLY